MLLKESVLVSEPLASARRQVVKCPRHSAKTITLSYRFICQLTGLSADSATQAIIQFERHLLWRHRDLSGDQSTYAKSNGASRACDWQQRRPLLPSAENGAIFYNFLE